MNVLVRLGMFLGATAGFIKGFEYISNNMGIFSSWFGPQDSPHLEFMRLRLELEQHEFDKEFSSDVLEKWWKQKKLWNLLTDIEKEYHQEYYDKQIKLLK